MPQLPDIQQQVLDDFLARLRRSKELDPAARKRLRALFESGEKIKAEAVIAAILGGTEIP